MKIIELILDEAQDIMGIDAISIVENPAIEENFLALKNEEIKLAEIDKEKKILMGALLIPNKPIYRTDHHLFLCCLMALLRLKVIDNDDDNGYLIMHSRRPKVSA